MNGPAKYLMRGLPGRCPTCGEGHLFRAFVKVADHCEKCGEPFRYHRADDFPAYLVIVLVGHIVVPIAMWIEIAYSAVLLAAGRDRAAADRRPGARPAAAAQGRGRRAAVAHGHARLRRGEAARAAA